MGCNQPNFPRKNNPNDYIILMLFNILKNNNDLIILYYKLKINTNCFVLSKLRAVN